MPPAWAEAGNSLYFRPFARCPRPRFSFGARFYPRRAAMDLGVSVGVALASLICTPTLIPILRRLTGLSFVLALAAFQFSAEGGTAYWTSQVGTASPIQCQFSKGLGMARWCIQTTQSPKHSPQKLNTRAGKHQLENQMVLQHLSTSGPV